MFLKYQLFIELFNTLWNFCIIRSATHQMTKYETGMKGPWYFHLFQEVPLGVAKFEKMNIRRVHNFLLFKFSSAWDINCVVSDNGISTAKRVREAWTVRPKFISRFEYLKNDERPNNKDCEISADLYGRQQLFTFAWPDTSIARNFTADDVKHFFWRIGTSQNSAYKMFVVSSSL